MKSKQIVKPYNIAMNDDGTAEINMYGDVMTNTPRDWDGNPIPGDYISAEEFLKDIENIKTASNITVHINSGGGDLYAGLAIYNRLKMLSGHVTTINDGLAASAASLIFQAGDTRKMNKGSNLMAHGASGFLFGFYSVEDMQEITKQFKAHNKAIANVYAEAMGVTYEEARSFVSGETWLTGQEAVDKGLADEVIETEEPKGPSGFMAKLTKNINPTMAAAAPPLILNLEPKESTGGKEQMEIKDTNGLREAYPELVAEIEKAADANAVAQERARIKGIEEIAASIPDQDMVTAAKFGENPVTAESLALEAIKRQSQIASGMLAAMEQDAKPAEVVAAAAPEETEKDKAMNVLNNAVNRYKEFKGGKK